MNIIDELFKENEPKAKHKFISWFHCNQNGNLEIDKMPEYMALSALVTWLDSKGLYIDRDTERFCFRIWDYRDSEPDKDVTVEWHPDDTQNENLKLAIKMALEMYYKGGSFYKKIESPITYHNIDDLPF